MRSRWHVCLAFSLLLAGLPGSISAQPNPVFLSTKIVTGDTARSDDASDDVPQLLMYPGAGAEAIRIVAWNYDPAGDGPGLDKDIAFARSTDGGGTWSQPKFLNTNAMTDVGRDAGVRMASDGTAIVAVWQSNDTLGGQKGTDDDIVVARSADGGETWSDPEVLNDPSGPESGDDESPSIATNGMGLWVVT